MSDYEQAVKRIDGYGEQYQNYSAMASTYQTVTVICAMSFVSGYWMISSGLLYLVIATYQYMLGSKVYSDLFDICLLRLKAGLCTQEHINSDGKNRPIKIVHWIKTLVWAWLMIYISALIWSQHV